MALLWKRFTLFRLPLDTIIFYLLSNLLYYIYTYKHIKHTYVCYMLVTCCRPSFVFEKTINVFHFKNLTFIIVKNITYFVLETQLFAFQKQPFSFCKQKLLSAQCFHIPYCFYTKKRPFQNVVLNDNAGPPYIHFFKGNIRR